MLQKWLNFHRIKIWTFKSVHTISITKSISFAKSLWNPLMNKPGSPCFKFCTTCDWLSFQCQQTFDQSHYSYLLPTQPRAMTFLWPLRSASVFVWIGANKNFGRPRTEDTVQSVLTDFTDSGNKLSCCKLSVCVLNQPAHLEKVSLCRRIGPNIRGWKSGYTKVLILSCTF